MDNDITVVFRFKDDFTLPKMKECLIPTQDAKPSFEGRRMVLCPSGFIIFGQQKTIRIFFIPTSHRGWSTAKNTYEIL